MATVDTDVCDARAVCSCPRLKQDLQARDHFKVELSTEGPIRKNDEFDMTVTAMKGSHTISRTVTVLCLTSVRYGV